MTVAQKFDGVSEGDVLFQTTEHIDRDALVRYAGASGDFNGIHYNDTYATDAGLPGVIAHGMLTMALAGSAAENWLGDPTAVAKFGTRFSAMVPVPVHEGTDLSVVGTLGAMVEGAARIELAVTNEGKDVLSKSYVEVRFS